MDYEKYGVVEEVAEEPVVETTTDIVPVDDVAIEPAESGTSSNSKAIGIAIGALAGVGVTLAVTGIRKLIRKRKEKKLLEEDGSCRVVDVDEDVEVIDQEPDTSEDAHANSSPKMDEKKSK